MNLAFDRFKGSANYVTSEPLRNAVNVSIALGRPLLIRGEPGTGKTLRKATGGQEMACPFVPSAVVGPCRKGD